MSGQKFSFQSGNARKLLALPLYVLGFLISLVVPRTNELWVFGSGAGVGEGALEVARELRRRQQHPSNSGSACVSDASMNALQQSPRIVWLTRSTAEAEQAASEGFESIAADSIAGWWATLRAGILVVTHGLGDVNRFGTFGGRIVQLWHGVPLKRIHFDSPVTTRVSGPAPVRWVLNKMYRAGANSVSLYIAGSETSAERLRSAFGVVPGKVALLGDARDDALAQAAQSGDESASRRSFVCDLLNVDPKRAGRLVLYAPTWRDGEADPGIPTGEEVAALEALAGELAITFVFRPHPLGVGPYQDIVGERIRVLDAATVRDVTPLLSGFDAVITDYSSLAIDFALTLRPIVWFAPDLENYTNTRGLYEPLQVTASGSVVYSWAGVIEELKALFAGGPARAAYQDAVQRTRVLRQRFHRFTDGKSAARAVDAINELLTPYAELVPDNAVFFESFYGRNVSDNPLAIDAEMTRRFPHTPRYWSVQNESQTVPEGATPVIVGSRLWHAARTQARLLVVNDWLRLGFRRGRHQTVLQTWHGTPLKHLALTRPQVSLRTRIAIRRESRRWSALITQNPHSSRWLVKSYAFGGEVLETGYPRDDRLARNSAGGTPIHVSQTGARRRLGVNADALTVLYAPTWRDHGGGAAHEMLNLAQLHERVTTASKREVTILSRSHSRVQVHGAIQAAGDQPRSGVVDAGGNTDLNDAILAADLIITDYSSLMFDASITGVPHLFYTPDFERYRTVDRGFTFDFTDEAPGPLVHDEDTLVLYLERWAKDPDHTDWVVEYADARRAWRERFNPHDDGHAAERVVRWIEERGVLSGDG